MLDHRHAMPTLPPAAARLILEDATTAMGGSVHGQLVGSLGHATVVIVGPPMWPRSSGAIVATARENVAERLRGEPSLAPLDSVTDAGLRADLASVADRVEAFQAAAAVYDSAWRDKGIDLYAVEPPRGTTSSRSEYVIGVPDPDGLAAALAEEGIEARRPLNERLHRVLSDPSEAFPGARTFYTRALQLPNHPGLDLGELLFVADLVVRHLRAARA
jgi:dTDP-4-amino-4,6-dideoxygalactose transaminase